MHVVHSTQGDGRPTVVLKQPHFSNTTPHARYTGGFLTRCSSLVTDAQAALAGNQAYCLVSQVMVAYPDGSNLILCAGHCAEVEGGAFCQIIVPLLWIESGSVSFLVSPFVDASSHGSCHPEAKLPWLTRGSNLRVVSSDELRHRAHVVPYFGGSLSADEKASYLVNRGIWRERKSVSEQGEEEEADEGSLIFSLCPAPGCNGRVGRKPEDTARRPCLSVTCPECSRQFQW